MGGIIAAVVIVVVIVVAVIGYAVAGYAFASSRGSSADNTLNAVITNENAITAQFNSSDTLTLLDQKNATSAEFTQNKTSSATVVTQSQAAGPTITSDDDKLAAAEASLKENSWLTVFSHSTLDTKASKIEHWRNALASAKTVTADLVQLGTFIQAYDDSLIDIFNVDTTANASDFAGMASALGSLKTDVAKAISLSNAPGLPPDMKAFLTDVQALGAITTQLLNDAIAGNDLTSDEATLNSDATKVDAHDIVAMNTAITAFYTPLIDAYNSEVSKANSM